MRFFKAVLVVSAVGLFGCSNAILSEITRENLAGQKFTNQPEIESLIQTSSQATEPEQQYGEVTIGQTVSGYLSSSSAEPFHRYVLRSLPAGTRLVFDLSGPSNADFDLWVWYQDWHKSQGETSQEHVDITLSNQSDVTFFPLAYSGSGNYTVQVSSPSSGRTSSYLGPYQVIDFSYVGQSDMDGDSFVVASQISPFSTNKVRYLGIDTPELTPSVECFASEATRFNFSVIANNSQRVWLETGIRSTDVHGRLLAWVHLSPDGSNLLNERLLREGYAKVFKDPDNDKYLERFINAQIEAVKNRRGQWQSNGGCDPYADSALAIAVVKNWGDQFVVVVNRGNRVLNLSDFELWGIRDRIFSLNSRELWPNQTYRIPLMFLSGETPLPGSGGALSLRSRSTGAIVHEYGYRGF